ncbi:unnamed protein product [Hanseniaspora opuntiae]
MSEVVTRSEKVDTSKRRRNNNKRRRRDDDISHDNNKKSRRDSFEKRSKHSKSGKFETRAPKVDDGASYRAKMTRNYKNSIFIGNLPYHCTSEHLTKEFDKFGNVIRSDIVTQKGRHRGMGTVEFSEHRSVIKAIDNMNNVKFMGRIIFVRKDNPPPEDNFALKDEAKRSVFDEVGDRENAQKGFESRGFGVCNMETKEQAISVLQYCSALTIEGRTLDCKLGKIGWVSPDTLSQPEAAKDTENSDVRVMNTAELNEREMIKRREAERSMRDQGTFSFVEELMNANKREEENKVITEEPEKNDKEIAKTEDMLTEGKEEKIEEPPKSSTFLLMRNVTLDADSKDIVELCQSFGDVITSTRDLESKQGIELAEKNKDVLSKKEGSIIVQFENPVSDESCVKVLNGFNYGGQELEVSLHI